MAKAVYVGVGSKAHKMKKAYIGIGGKARKVKKMYIGVGGKARLCYSAELDRYGMAAALSTARYGVRTATVGNYALFAGFVCGWIYLQVLFWLQRQQFRGCLQYLPYEEHTDRAELQTVRSCGGICRRLCAVCWRRIVI